MPGLVSDLLRAASVMFGIAVAVLVTLKLEAMVARWLGDAPARLVAHHRVRGAVAWMAGGLAYELCYAWVKGL